MIGAWIAYVLLTGSLVAACVAAVDSACRAAELPRRWSWFAGIMVVLVFAIVAPRAREEVTPQIGAASSIVDLPNYGPISGTIEPYTEQIISEQRQIAPPRQTDVAGALQRLIPADLDRLFGISWAAASLGLALLILFVHARYIRARRSWPWTDLHGVRVRVAPTAGPAVVGAFAPDIVVPAWLFQRSREEQLLVLRHEQEHVRAGDPLLLASAWTCAVLVPWHPAVWWMLGRLRLAVEMDCDARVLSRGVEPQLYGNLLIELSQHSAGLPVSATALADRTSHLERRLIAMNSNRPSFSSLRITTFASLGAAFFLAACALRMPAKAPNADLNGVAQLTELPVVFDFQMTTLDIPSTSLDLPVTKFEVPVTALDFQITALDVPVTSFNMPVATFDFPPVSQGFPVQAHLAESIPTQAQTQARKAADSSRGDFLRYVQALAGIVDSSIHLLRYHQGQARANRDSVAEKQREELLRQLDAFQSNAGQGRASRDTAATVQDARATVQAARAQLDLDYRSALLRERETQDALLRVGTNAQNTTYYIDGVKVTYAQGVAMPTILISTVQVTQPTPDSIIVRITSVMGAARATGTGGRIDTSTATRSGAGSSLIRPLGLTLDHVVEVPPPNLSRQPLLIINGVIQPAGFSGEDLDSRSIASIDVVRGAAAVELYGERAANGVIRITTKRD